LRGFNYNVLYYFKNYEVAGRVKSIIRRFDPNARVYVFGSVVRGEYTALSDIDILAVISNLDLKYNIMVTVYSEKAIFTITIYYNCALASSMCLYI
jgi:predicted nucleotidyltransferase